MLPPEVVRTRPLPASLVWIRDCTAKPLKIIALISTSNQIAKQRGVFSIAAFVGGVPGDLE